MKRKNKNWNVWVIAFRNVPQLFWNGDNLEYITYYTKFPAEREVKRYVKRDKKKYKVIKMFLTKG